MSVTGKVAHGVNYAPVTSPGVEFLSATREMKSKDEAATDRPARATSITLKNTAGGAKRAKGRHTFRSPSCAPVCSFTVANHSTPN